MNSRFSFKGKGSNLLATLFFAAILLVVGALFQQRMSELLIHYTENQTKRQAETLAIQAAEKLGAELDILNYIASKIEANPEEMERLMPLVFNEAGLKQGLLAIDGQAIFGDSLSLYTYDGIQTSVRGERAITFVQDRGILFTCPVFHGKNIKYVLYRLYPPETIRERFSISCYDDIGRMCVVTRKGDIIIPFAQLDEEDMDFMQSGELREFFHSMHRDMETSMAAARTFNTTRGDMLLLEAEIPGTNYLIAGFVPKEKASEGIGSLTLLVVWVFGLLMLLVAVGAMYLVQIRDDIYESEELKKAKAMAEEASRAKSNFLANMSHEIRTPINAVLGMNEMILRECEDRNILAYAEDVKAAGNTLLGIINDILDFSKIEAGKIEIIPVEYDLLGSLNDLVTMIQVRAESKNLSLVLNFDPNLPRRLYGDEIHIKQVITNILTNAVKYTEKGSVTFSVGFDRSEEAPDEVLLHVSVKDTGIGIKHEDLKKLFSEFERIEEKRNRKIEGTGLGMAITGKLLRMMGTELQVDSVYGSGSEFYFSLRQKVVSWEPLGDYQKARQVHLSEHKKYQEKFIAPDACVLVVDDTPLNLVVFKGLLKQTQIQIDTANDGDEGISLSREKKYDLIFLDHMMPGKDGIETLKYMKSMPDNPNSGTPVISLTANAISGAREEYLAAGFQDYLTKPVDSAKLESVLIQYLPQEKVRVREEGTEDAPAEENILPSWLQELEGIDTQEGIGHCGSEAAYLDTVKVFAEAAWSGIADIEGYFRSEDWPNYTTKVHALKSTARIIGARLLSEMAKRLEYAGNAGEIEKIKVETPALLSIYRSFAEKLAPLCPPKQRDEEKVPIDEAALREAYDTLKEFVASFDYDNAMFVLESLEEYRLPEDEEKRYQSIRTAIEKLDWEKAGQILADG
ncbi:response regulator [Selenomonas sp. AB3002]|uniref:hybrid sensor histidine kinase/response regulator n=1 Tax=Selenomonas sp. AB3002 TaxID=1392502 RepID=UPI00068DD65D